MAKNLKDQPNVMQEETDTIVIKNDKLTEILEKKDVNIKWCSICNKMVIILNINS